MRAILNLLYLAKLISRSPVKTLSGSAKVSGNNAINYSFEGREIRK
jgi:hypothetical protein